MKMQVLILESSQMEHVVSLYFLMSRLKWHMIKIIQILSFNSGLRPKRQDG